MSNQSPDTPQSNIKIEIDGKLIFQEKTSTDDQQKWKEIDVANTSMGDHTIHIQETTTNTNKLDTFKVDHESWIAIMFWGIREGFTVSYYNHPVGLQ